MSGLSRNPSVPEDEQEQLRELHRLLELGGVYLVGPKGERHALPPSAYDLLLRFSEDINAGAAVAAMPRDETVTTQRAAEVLGVSRPYLIRLLEAGAIPFHKVGTHRRLLVGDLISYAAKRDAERKAALNRMAKEAFDDGLYDRAHIPEGGQDY